jgi:Matrixin
MLSRGAHVLGLALGVAGFVGVFACAERAAAYCQNTTVDPASSCPEQCSGQGLPLRWARPELTFWLNLRGFPGFSEAALRTAVLDAFSAWEDVSCSGQLVDYRFDLAEGYTTEGAAHYADADNRSVLVYEEAEAWDALGHSSAAFAVTTVAYSRSSGAISEADIEFNGGMPTWSVCPPDGCTDDSHTDLVNVLTHELGHTLGLAHSDVADSTMSCSATPGETVKRTLAPDDLAGICATYPPGHSFPGVRRVVRGATCSADPGARGASGTALALALLAGARTAARRRQRRRRARSG